MSLPLLQSTCIIISHSMSQILNHPDEDNWRNDYPDEEDIFQSDSDEDGLHSRTAYRYRDSYGK